MRKGILLIIISNILALIAGVLVFVFIIALILGSAMSGLVTGVNSAWKPVVLYHAGSNIPTAMVVEKLNLTSTYSSTRLHLELQYAPGPTLEHPQRIPPPEELERIIHALERVLPIAILILALLLAAFILELIGLWGFFVPGASKVGRANPEFSTASTLIKIGYFWGYLIGLILGVIFVGLIIYSIILRSFALFILSLMGLLIGAIIVAILVLIGIIGLILLAYKFYELEKISLYLAVLILLILSLVFSFMSFISYKDVVSLLARVLALIAWILLYVALGESIKRASTAQAPPTPPQYPTVLPPV
jgi:hypothetical protein